MIELRESSSPQGAAPVAAGSAESLKFLPHGFMWDVCCREGCGRIYGLKLSAPLQDGLLSHGYCEDCAPLILAEWSRAVSL